MTDVFMFVGLHLQVKKLLCSKNSFLLKLKISSNIIFVCLIFQILGQAHDTETSLFLGIEPRFLGHMAGSLVAIPTDHSAGWMLLYRKSTEHLKLGIIRNHDPST
jgi:hypothetical protein